MAAIFGTVIDGGGQPVAAARVGFVSGPGELPEVAALTDAAGRFALGAPRPGRYCLGCTTDAGGSAQAEVEVGSADADIEIRLGG